MEIKGSESERGREGWKRNSSDEVGNAERRLCFTGLSSVFSERNLVLLPPQPSVTCAAQEKVDPTPKVFLSPGVKIWTAKKRP